MAHVQDASDRKCIVHATRIAVRCCVWRRHVCCSVLLYVVYAACKTQYVYLLLYVSELYAHRVPVSVQLCCIVWLFALMFRVLQYFPAAITSSST
jgi:hypothetical protein